jgi:hypothetical protein
MAQKPAISGELSGELLALFSRAELATADAQRLLDENERWRRGALQKLDYMFELGAEFRRVRRAYPPLSASDPGSSDGGCRSR